MTDRVWTDLPRISPSSVGDLTSCPKRYTETRILHNWGSNNREYPEGVAHGTATHAVLRDIFQGRQGGLVDLANVGALARTAVFKGRYPKGFDRERAIDRVIEAVCGYVRSQKPEDIEGTIRCEDQIEFPFVWEGKPLCLVSTSLDRTLLRPSVPGRLVVKEYKTSRPKIDLQEVLSQCSRQNTPILATTLMRWRSTGLRGTAASRRTLWRGGNCVAFIPSFSTPP